MDCLWQVLLGETPKENRAEALATDLIPLCVLLPLAEIDLAKEVSSQARTLQALPQLSAANAATAFLLAYLECA